MALSEEQMNYLSVWDEMLDFIDRHEIGSYEQLESCISKHFEPSPQVCVPNWDEWKIALNMFEKDFKQILCKMR